MYQYTNVIINVSYQQQMSVPRALVSNYRIQLRKKHQQSERSEQRQRLMYSSEVDYNLLRNINLSHTMHSLRHQLSQQAVSEMFLYATSNEADHLFFLFDQHVPRRLLSHLALTDNWGHREVKLFFVLCNYTAYDKEFGREVVPLLHLAWYMPQPHLKELVLICLHNVGLCEGVLTASTHAPFLKLVLEEMEGIRVSGLVQEQILGRAFTFLQALLQQCSHVERVSEVVGDVMREVIAQLHCFDKNSGLMKSALQVVQTGLRQHIQQHPYLVLRLELDIVFKLMVGHVQRLLNVCTRDEQTIVVQLLVIGSIIHGLNIPSDEDEMEYYGVLQRWVESSLEVGALLFAPCHLYDPNLQTIHWYFLQLLEPALLDQPLCEILLSDCLILSALFYFARGDTLRLKKESIICLCNIVRVEVQSQLLLQNKMIQLIAAYMGQYVDVEINQALLDAITILSCKGVNREVFQNQQGTVKIEKLISLTHSQQLRVKAEEYINNYVDM